ncbi:unnamed protein product [Amoebophrya sp. A120]|nr:unnamed protein product [Amoebophrya sp. A120]|eukprot:GSA120T00007277001.1
MSAEWSDFKQAVTLAVDAQLSVRRWPSLVEVGSSEDGACSVPGSAISHHALAPVPLPDLAILLERQVEGCTKALAQETLRRSASQAQARSCAGALSEIKHDEVEDTRPKLLDTATWLCWSIANLDFGRASGAGVGGASPQGNKRLQQHREALHQGTLAASRVSDENITPSSSFGSTCSSELITAARSNEPKNVHVVEWQEELQYPVEQDAMTRSAAEDALCLFSKNTAARRPTRGTTSPGAAVGLLQQCLATCSSSVVTRTSALVGPGAPPSRTRSMENDRQGYYLKSTSKGKQPLKIGLDLVQRIGYAAVLLPLHEEQEAFLSMQNRARSSSNMFWLQWLALSSRVVEASKPGNVGHLISGPHSSTVVTKSSTTTEKDDAQRTQTLPALRSRSTPRTCKQGLAVALYQCAQQLVLQQGSAWSSCAGQEGTTLCLSTTYSRLSFATLQNLWQLVTNFLGIKTGDEKAARAPLEEGDGKKGNNELEDEPPPHPSSLQNEVSEILCRVVMFDCSTTSTSTHDIDKRPRRVHIEQLAAQYLPVDIIVSLAPA